MWTLALMIFACDEPEPPAVEDKCPEIGMETLAGDWIKVDGNTPDQTTRLRVFQEGGQWVGWYVGGDFRKILMSGALRDDELVLTQVVEGEDETKWKAGDLNRTRIYFKPHKPRCAIRTVTVTVQADDKEKQRHSGYVEYLPLPEQYAFTFRPCDEPLFLGDAAKDKELADKQVAETGGADPMVSFGEAVPAGLWSDAAADGDPACTYTMDLYFDDLAVEGAQGVAAGEVADGARRWYHDWYAPYSGNHNFEAYRYRQCDGGERELIAVACNNAVLQ